MVPGVRPRVPRAETKLASSATAVLPPAGMAGREAIGSGRELELEDDAALAVLSSLLHAPRPRAALRAMPATSSFLAGSVAVIMWSSLCRSVGFRGHSARRPQTDCTQATCGNGEPIGVPRRTSEVSLAIRQTTDLYAAALHSMTEPDGHRHWYARYEGGPRRSLGEGLRRWCGTVDPVDQELLARAPGLVLDAGCGPGRLVIELARQGRDAAGIDTSRVAVRLARAAGATALCRSIFDPVPGEGGWDAVLLADGNIGIGGDPAALLARCRALVGPAGRVLVELDPPGTGLRADRVRLERGAERGRWFDWAHVGADAVGEPAAAAGLRVAERWRRGGRSFAVLIPAARV